MVVSAGRRSPWKPLRPAGRPFASGLNYYKLFWLFFIGSVAGVAVETAWCLLTRHHYESRVGVVFGPFNPVYGFGAVLLTLCLRRLAGKRDLWVFLGSMVIGGGFEYLCSLLQELAFGTVSWEYSHTQLNLGGRTNLMYAFFWGILGLLWVKDFYPHMSRWIEKIPRRAGVPLTWALTVLMVADMGLSALAVGRETQRREGVPATNVVQRLLDEHFPDERLDEIYPNMRPRDAANPR